MQLKLSTIAFAMEEYVLCTLELILLIPNTPNGGSW